MRPDKVTPQGISFGYPINHPPNEDLVFVKAVEDFSIKEITPKMSFEIKVFAGYLIAWINPILLARKIVKYFLLN
ncbi:hypothetical protein [Polynucleobacter sp. Nonnen-W13]|uniref:hypothetical protein n=1 Tax=Polynucleobacter sp. Nonnen-W13 TaxID=1855625 RepID=UPI001C0D0128|nr:hypothetical protein [Polynucleobacter sp. Nonnen-W13]MBU3558518.1 hypothetical protein [Polynucleobacter sp. Nonnen-W13]